MAILNEYIDYLRYVRRYSSRTAEIYEEVLKGFVRYCVDAGAGADADAAGSGDDLPEVPDEALLKALTPTQIRNYEVHLLDACRVKPRTVNQHLSALSSFCHYLISRKLLASNPVSVVKRPKQEQRLPEFYRDDALEKYFQETAWWAGRESLQLHAGQKGDLVRNKGAKEAYMRRLSRLIISILYSTGIRRAELISLTRASFDPSRKVLQVRGKGDKMRTIPLVFSLIEEILVYLEAVEMLMERPYGSGDPLLLTPAGGKLYPSFVDRAVKAELGAAEGISGRLSPHVLRHSLATEVLSEGGDLYSIKELLGHASLAATQIYTHNSIAQLSKVYQSAHPRAKKRR